MKNHTKGDLNVGMRNGRNANVLYVYDGPDEHHDSPVCSVSDMPIHTSLEEAKQLKGERFKRFQVGLSNAERLCAGWNLLNRLEEMGIDADKVPEIVEALRAFTHPDLSMACGQNVEGDKSPLFGRNKALLTLGDFRKARRALGLPVDTSERNLGK